MKNISITLALFLGFGFSNAQTQEYSAEQSSKFALDIYKQFAGESEKNIFFSPFSLSIAMGMTYAGAEGETKAQIADVFNFPINDENLHKELGSLQNQMVNKGNKGVEISIANQLWADKLYKFKCSYLRNVKKAYKAPVKRMPFRTEADKCRVEINKWVEDKTKNRIVDLLPEGSISDMTTLVLTNAIYFKGQWDNKFEEEDTFDEAFLTATGQTVSSRMMNTQDKYNIYQGNSIQMLELPYAGKDFSMLVVLPNEDTPLKEIEKNITLEKLNHYISLLVESDVRVSFPKFKFDSEFALKPTLSKMGMPIPFSNAADLSRMSGNKDLKIDEVFHKAFVEVSEEGTEAAAATAVVIVRKSVTIPVEFKANRPFMFIIRENSTGSILFMGRVNNPNN
ncbi:MAG: serpin family protein [Bacteroidetes bacterium HGW-Bacteroidetes-15]|nr:MAG: serpin family protein [Bacteroidetes bacterium HGW-Bacteroidetes-15]